MPSEFMLRDYRVKAGEMQEWVQEWRARIYSLRKRFGFEVIGAWTVGEDRFVWVLAYKGKNGDFQRADEEYYASKERKEINPDPARHLSEVKHWMTESVGL